MPLPGITIKFDIDGIEEVRRKFFGTLYNTYSFFALYANVDGFSIIPNPRCRIERPSRKYDRWIHVAAEYAGEGSGWTLLRYTNRHVPDGRFPIS
ncbi:MAG: hypothetical protein ACLRS8_18020 [Parabacteroides merdae]